MNVVTSETVAALWAEHGCGQFSYRLADTIAGEMQIMSRARCDPWMSVYLYYQRSTEDHFGEFVLVFQDENARPGSELVTGQAFRPGCMTLGELAARLSPLVGRLPVLAYGPPHAA